MLAHAKRDVEIAGRAAAAARLALTPELQTRAVVDAGRDANAQLVGPTLRPAPPTRGAGARDPLPLSVAVTARLRDREEALLEAHLPRATTLWTGFRLRTRLGAAAAARLAGGEARDGDRLLAAERRLLEGDLQVVAEILAPPGAASGPPRPAGAPQ